MIELPDYQITQLPNSMMSVAVLLSGGLDSAVLVAEEAAHAREGQLVQPVYVSVGLAWEAAERTAVDRFLDESGLASRIQPLAALSVDMHDVYPATHWAMEGRPPGYHTPDEDVYLHGRNIVLLAKAGIYCASRGIARLAIGTLDHNPFPDATPEFRGALAQALSLGLAHTLAIDAPYAKVEKADVIRRGAALGVPMQFTLSCMNPEASSPFPRHCGRCSKCRERHDAFLAASVPDSTDYVDRSFVH
jgi:7-cyano-7-deazaguanine synthase